MLRKKIIMVVLLGLLASPLLTQAAEVTPLMTKDLGQYCPGKEGEMIIVEYAPGWSDPIHRHNAYAFVYVLEGSVLMKLKGKKEVRLTPKAPTMYMSSAGTPAVRSQQNFSSS